VVIQVQRVPYPTPINTLREAKVLHYRFKIIAWGLLFYTRKASSVAMTMIENMTMMTIHTVNRSRL
jgi:hypothetical protein